jgi:hypothetical protein
MWNITADHLARVYRSMTLMVAYQKGRGTFKVHQTLAIIGSETPKPHDGSSCQDIRWHACHHTVHAAHLPEGLVYAWGAVRCEAYDLGIAATLNVEHTCVGVTASVGNSLGITT